VRFRAPLHKEFESPWQKTNYLYSWTASGRLYEPIEEKINE
jgi:hypothetical protein